jgi:hypothetical protein
MKDCGTGFHGKHLKQALEYVSVPEKTGQGKRIGALNCTPDSAYEQMVATKKKFGKTDQRQGYHLIISFQENEVDADTAFEIIGKFAEEYLGEKYEALYTVHDNTAHVHGHIIFNSVSFLDGKKYHYVKGDWAKEIQPVTNRLCEEYGLSTIEIDKDRAVAGERYREWDDFKDGTFVWSDMIRRDVDACIVKAESYEEFLTLLREKGYGIRQNKYLALLPMGMKKYRRCKTLGEHYSEERIRERILTEWKLPPEEKEYQKMKIVRIKKVSVRKAKSNRLQKRYRAKLFRLGRWKKKPYSQVWKYREQIRQMQKTQEEYLFLCRHDIRSGSDLEALRQSYEQLRRETSAERKQLYKEKARFQPLFQVAEQMKELSAAEISFQDGDEFFAEEHEKYQELSEKMKAEGYSYEEIESLQNRYREKGKVIFAKDSEYKANLRLVGNLIAEMQQMEKQLSVTAISLKDTEIEKKNMEENMQPKR